MGSEQDATGEAQGSLAGRTLSHFRVGERIGRGGMGVVYRAEDVSLSRTVALKVLPPALMEDEERRRRFLREARSAAAVTHPHIATVYEVGFEEGVVFLAMEHVEGASLRERLDRDGPLDAEEVARLGSEMARALAKAHEAGVIHRDLKLDNVMVTSEGHAKLLDFGLAKLLARDDQSPEQIAESETVSQLTTKEGRLLGTPGYMSPEQAAGKDLDGRSDVFSLGVVLYELLAGKRPFRGETPMELIVAISRDDPEPLREAAPDTPDELVRIVERCLEKEPADRFEDARELAEALASLVSAPVTRSSTAIPARRRQRLGLWMSLGVVAAALLTTAVLTTTNGAGSEPSTSSDPASEGTAPVPPPIEVDEGVLACPILEASGVEEPNAWLGAAAAGLVCRRVHGHLGQRPDAILPPAELLGYPDLPSRELVEVPYDEDSARRRSLEASKERGDGWVEGTVRIDEERVFRVELALRSSAGLTGRATGEGLALYLAVNHAVDALVDSGHLPHAKELAPSVAAWMPGSSVDISMLHRELQLASQSGARFADKCRALLDATANRPEWAATRAGMHRLCKERLPEAIAGRPPPLHLDRSSPQALARTAIPYVTHHRSPDLDGLAADLAEARAGASGLGRALLAYAEARVHVARGKHEAARPLLRQAVGRLRRDADVRWLLVQTAQTSRAIRAASRAEAAWTPWASGGWWGIGEFADDPDTEVSMIGRATTLQPGNTHMAFIFGTALVEDRRLEEAHTLAAELRSRELGNELTGRCVDATANVAEARFDAALNQLLSALLDLEQYALPLSTANKCLSVLLHVAAIVERSREVADRVARHFVLSEPPGLYLRGRMWRGKALTRVCALASPDVGKRCVDVLRKLRTTEGPRTTEWSSIEPFFRSIEHYVDGELQAAVEIWRGLSDKDLIPVPALEQAGATALASSLDRGRISNESRANARGGATLAHAREAKRAAERGDTERARKLAKQVVDAWSLADTEVPAVDEMRALLAELPAGG